ncbi:hypothetical protein HWI79_1364 [Cryptosporidium felis]|nr:hypothetical protein HWI79_1364 [Cryptosporidium felis]
MLKKRSMTNNNGANKRVNLSIMKHLLQNKYYTGMGTNGYKIPQTLSQKLEFKRMKLSCVLNITNDLPQTIRGHCKLSKPSKIIEVVFSKEILFILNDSGLGIAYNRNNNRMLCIINRSPSEMIRSLFYNKMNNTIVVAFHHDPTILNCTIFNIEDIILKRNLSSNIGKEFQKIKVGNPGFIEFDDGNGRIVVADPQNDHFTFWDMSNYNKLYQISGQNFLEMRISDGTVVFFRQPSYSTIEAHLCNIVNGDNLERTMVKLKSSMDIQFLELHREYLLLKQEGCSIRVWNLLTSSTKKISRTRDFHPKAFIFFDQMAEITNFTNFLTVSTEDITVWSCSNFGDVEIKFKITLPGIQTADCVNVCFSKGIIMTYCNGLMNDQNEGSVESMVAEEEEFSENMALNDALNESRISYIPQFIQASKYFKNFCMNINSAKEVDTTEPTENEANISLSCTVTGFMSFRDEEDGEKIENKVSNIRGISSSSDRGPYKYLEDGFSTPVRPLFDEVTNFSNSEKNDSLRKAIYIHSLYDGCKLGTIFCDVATESEEIVLLHYDSDGMEIACGTNQGLLLRYRHIFGR